MSRANTDLFWYLIVGAVIVGTGAAATILATGGVFIEIICQNMDGMDVWWAC